MDNFWSPFWIWESSVPNFICDEIIIAYENQSSDQFRKGTLAKTGKTHLEMRRSDILFLEENWINAMLQGYIRYANNLNFLYDLSGEDKELAQLTRYTVGHHYHTHRDFGPPRDDQTHTRKLSLSLQLSDSDEYDGGDILMDMSGWTDNPNDSQFKSMSRSKGSVIVFDSRTPHKVTPITRGTRYSLVKWYHGDTPLR
tara:strand:+ start:79 stop:672 length:594 start_codon:yes stop_codon:yes gene_type:complete